MKKIILSLFASLLFLSQAANAEIKFGDQKNPTATLAFNAGYNSTYVWRGVDQNALSGSPYIGADLTTPIGIYAGVWTAGASNNGTGDGYSQEVDIYAGITKTFGSVTADVGIIEYRYPGADRAANPVNFTEAYAKLKFAPEKAPYTIGLAYFEDDTKGNQGSRGSSAAKSYQEVSLTYDFGTVQSLISYGEYKNTTDVTTVTLSKSISDIGFALSYIDSQKAGSNGTKDREFLVLNVSKTF
jgi:uncharacterized protein (TIGR02001 family)